MSKSYYQYNFKTEPDDSLKCLICLEVASEPFQHSCGRLFCKDCIEMNGNNPCPNCREERPQYFPDKRGNVFHLYVFDKHSPLNCLAKERVIVMTMRDCGI